MQVAIFGCKHDEFNCLEFLTKLFHHYFNNKNHEIHKDFFVPLLTCNRIEIYISSPDVDHTMKVILSDIPKDIMDIIFPKMYCLYGDECFNHLVHVTCGLDSLIIGETEIQGQVKKAYENSCNDRKLNSDLHFIFQKAMAISKHIRSKFELGRGMPDLEYIILSIISKHFLNSETQVLLIGASDINYKIAKHVKLKKSNLHVCNRTNENAVKFAEELEIGLLPWEKRNEWHSYHWVVSGVTTTDYLITQEHLTPGWSDGKLAFDLGLPHNIDPRICEAFNLQLYDIEQLGRLVQAERAALTKIVSDVTDVIQEKVNYHLSSFNDKSVQNKKAA